MAATHGMYEKTNRFYRSVWTKSCSAWICGRAVLWRMLVLSQPKDVKPAAFQRWLRSIGEQARRVSGVCSQTTHVTTQTTGFFVRTKSRVSSVLHSLVTCQARRITQSGYFLRYYRVRCIQIMARRWAIEVLVVTVLWPTRIVRRDSSNSSLVLCSINDCRSTAQCCTCDILCATSNQIKSNLYTVQEDAK